MRWQLPPFRSHQEEVRSRSLKTKLLFGDQWEVCPQSAAKKDECESPYQNGLENRIVLDIPQARNHRSADSLLRQLCNNSRWLPAVKNDDDRNKGHRIKKERCFGTSAGNNHASDCRTKCSGDVDADAGQCYRCIKLFGRNKFWNNGLPSR